MQAESPYQIEIQQGLEQGKKYPLSSGWKFSGSFASQAESLQGATPPPQGIQQAPGRADDGIHKFWNGGKPFTPLTQKLPALDSIFKDGLPVKVDGRDLLFKPFSKLGEDKILFQLSEPAASTENKFLTADIKVHGDPLLAMAALKGCREPLLSKIGSSMGVMQALFTGGIDVTVEGKPVTLKFGIGELASVLSRKPFNIEILGPEGPMISGKVKIHDISHLPLILKAFDAVEDQYAIDKKLDLFTMEGENSTVKVGMHTGESDELFLYPPSRRRSPRKTS